MANLPSYVETGDPVSTAVTVTITDNKAQPQQAAEPTVSLTVSPTTVVEGSSVTVTATLSSTLSKTVTIPLTVTGGTSEDGDHGTLASLAILAGGTSASGTITTSHDTDRDDETFTVALGTLPPGLAAGTASSVEVTITDDGAQPQQQEQPQPEQQEQPQPLAAQLLTAAFEGAPEEHDGKAAFWLNARFSEALGTEGSTPAVSSFAVTGGRAKRVERVEAGLWRVRVKPGSWREVTVELAATSDCAADGAVCASGGRALSNTSSATIDGPVRLRIADGRAREGQDASLDFAVTLSRAAAQAVSVDYATKDGTATAGADYTAATGTLTFAAGETAKTVSVAILDDTIDERQGDVQAQALEPPGGLAAGDSPRGEGSYPQGGGGRGRGRRHVDPGPGGDDCRRRCGDGGRGGRVYADGFARSVRGPCGHGVGGPARRDFTEAPALGTRTVTIPAGTESAAFTVATVDDSADEADGAVVATVAGGTGYTVGAAERATVTVADDDEPLSEVSIAAGSAVTEGAAAGFTLTAAPAPGADLAVAVSVAQSGDVAAAAALGSRTVTIPAGQATALFTVATVDDSADEADGGIVASVAAGSGYTVGAAARATVTVADNDESLPEIETKRSIAREGTDTAVVFRVRLSRAGTGTVTVDYATADGAGTWASTLPAAAGADYTATSGTLTFAPGETQKTLAVPILDDSIDEGDGVLPAALLEP